MPHMANLPWLQMYVTVILVTIALLSNLNWSSCNIINMSIKSEKALKSKKWPW